ncbi:hypothetical protein IJT93_01710 [bacterium]|nr:hypothetical protein [bacterium]
MSKYLSFIVGVLTVLFVSALSAYADPHVLMLENRDERYDKQLNKVYLTITYANVKIKNSEEYPALSKALDESHNRLSLQQVEKILKYYAPDCLEGVKKNPELNCSAEEKLVMCRADDTVMSFRSVWSEFYGSRPISTSLSYNFDTKSGKKLKLADVTADYAKLIELVTAKLKTEFMVRGIPFSDERVAQIKELLEGDRSGRQPVAWTIGNEGVNIHFDGADFGAYIFGDFDIIVLYDEYKDILKGRYFNAE